MMLPFLLCVWLVPHLPPMAARQATADISVWLITANPDGAIARGVRMGAEEMERTTGLLGRRLVLRESPMTAKVANADLPGTIRRSRGSRLVIIDLDPSEACEVLEELADAPRVIVMNPRVESMPCGAPHLALRLPQQRRHEVLKETAGRGGTLQLDEWHPSLQRYGARELNERYERRTHAAMDGDAWAGWFAVKAGAEAALRLPELSRGALVGADAPAFDGHKGVPLRFGTSGVLKQPVYIFDLSVGRPGKVVKEVP